MSHCEGVGKYILHTPQMIRDGASQLDSYLVLYRGHQFLEGYPSAENIVSIFKATRTAITILRNYYKGNFKKPSNASNVDKLSELILKPESLNSFLILEGYHTYWF